MFIRDLVLAASIGVHPHEHAARSGCASMSISAWRTTAPVRCRRAAGRPRRARPAWWTTKCVADAVRAHRGSGHVRLVETLAERIAEACLADRRVQLARVRVEKLDIFADATSAGVEIERRAARLVHPVKLSASNYSDMQA